MFEETAAFIISLTVFEISVTLSGVNSDLFKSLTPLAGDSEWFWKILTSEGVRLSKRELVDAILKIEAKKTIGARGTI